MYRPVLHISPKFLLAAALILPALAALSCSRDFGEGLQDEGYCNVGLRLTLDVVRTKAPAGNYDDGRSTAFENYIDIIDGDFRLLMFESVAPYRLVAEISNIEITTVDADTYSSKTYLLLGQAPRNVRDGSYKIMFLANWEGNSAAYPEMIPGAITIDDVAKGSRYSYGSDFRPGIGRGIPMYGIKDCESLKFGQDRLTDFGKLHLLRAMAKIEVKASEVGSPICGAELTHSNNAGMAVPFGIYSQGDYVRNSYINDYLDTIHIPSSTTVTGDIPFIRQPDGSFVLYVPEYDNTSASAALSRIHMTFDASDGLDEIYFDDDIDFKYYSAQAALDAGMNIGDRFDVKRNHYYRFTVTKKVDLSMKVEVDVIPYSEVVLEPGFGV